MLTVCYYSDMFVGLARNIFGSGSAGVYLKEGAGGGGAYLKVGAEEHN